MNILKFEAVLIELRKSNRIFLLYFMSISSPGFEHIIFILKTKQIEFQVNIATTYSKFHLFGNNYLGKLHVDLTHF